MQIHTQLIVTAPSKTVDADVENFDGKDACLEHDSLDNDPGTDSDDEAEEANQNDDIQKPREGLQ